MKNDRAANGYRTLKESRKFITAQQYRTIKGQLMAGDIQGAMKGIKKLKTKIIRSDEL